MTACHMNLDFHGLMLSPVSYSSVTEQSNFVRQKSKNFRESGLCWGRLRLVSSFDKKNKRVGKLQTLRQNWRTCDPQWLPKIRVLCEPCTWHTYPISLTLLFFAEIRVYLKSGVGKTANHLINRLTVHCN